MKNKYRTPSFETVSSDVNDDYWMRQFEKNLNKSAVQSRKQDANLFDQINSIMNGTKSKYSSVADAVEEMKERSGLTAYLDKIKVSEQELQEPIKTASIRRHAQNTQSVGSAEPLLFKDNPDIKSTIVNYIAANKGYLPIPAILERVMAIHKNDVSDYSKWEDHALLRFISQENLKAKMNNPSTYQSSGNLGMDTTQGEISQENTDAFHHLMPSSDY